MTRKRGQRKQKDAGKEKKKDEGKIGLLDPTLTQKACDGLPEGIWGRIAVGVARSDSQRVYALIEAENGGLFRSDDGGDTWTLINASRGLAAAGLVLLHARRSIPRNADIIYCPQVPLLKSIDGGKSFSRVKGHAPWRPSRSVDRSEKSPTA